MHFVSEKDIDRIVYISQYIKTKTKYLPCQDRANSNSTTIILTILVMY